MTANRIFWVMVGCGAVLFLASRAASFVGSAANSVWAAAGVGTAFAIIARLALRPFLRRAQEAGYFESEELANSSLIISALSILGTSAIGVYLIVRSADVGYVDYSKAFLGGFWIGASITWLASYVKSRTLDSAQ